MEEINARIISKGKASGEALVSAEPIGFLGGVDPETGAVIEKGHPLEGKNIAGKVLIFPNGKGSTVGSYVMLQLAKNGKAPAAIINISAEPIIAVGAIISKIPMVDQPAFSSQHTAASNRQPAHSSQHTAYGNRILETGCSMRSAINCAGCAQLSGMLDALSLSGKLVTVDADKGVIIF